MAYCKNCGTKLDDGAKFCPKCGTPTDKTPSIENVADGEPNPIKNNDIEHLSQVEQPKKRGCLKKIGIGLLVFCFLGALADKCGNNGSNTADEANAPQATEQISDEKRNKVEEQTRQEKERIAQEQQKAAEEKNSMSAFVGSYTYSYFYGNTNFKVFFRITLKSDGTFTHEPANEQTKGMIEAETVVDGTDYPSGGTWKVKDTSVGKGAFLDFEGEWGEGSITPDKSVIAIENMNGYKLKAPLVSND